MAGRRTFFTVRQAMDEAPTAAPVSSGSHQRHEAPQPAAGGGANRNNLPEPQRPAAAKPAGPKADPSTAGGAAVELPPRLAATTLLLRLAAPFALLVAHRSDVERAGDALFEAFGTRVAAVEAAQFRSPAPRPDDGASHGSSPALLVIDSISQLKHVLAQQHPAATAEAAQRQQGRATSVAADYVVLGDRIDGAALCKLSPPPKAIVSLARLGAT